MLLIYQLKVGLCLIAFYLLWKLLLSRETFHRFNRIALLAVMALAMVLPWVQVSLDVATPVSKGMVMLNEIIVSQDGATQFHQAASSWNMVNVATLVYFIGMAMVAAWLLHSQWSLRRLMKKGRKESLPGGITLHVVPGNQAPFSYFNHIVINEQDFRDNPREILIHEQAHIGLRHSWDVLFIGLVTMFQWWNPAAWLIGHELRQVHEYEADQAVLNNGIDARQYQLLLIKKSVGDQLFSMANSFNYQSLKKRIRMMSMNKSSQWNRLRALAVVPVIALAMLAFANPKSVAAVTANVQQDRTAQSEEQLPELVIVGMGLDKTADVEADSQTDDVMTEEQAPEETAPQSKKVYESVEEMPQFPGGQEALMYFLQNNVKYPENAAKNNIQGRVVVQFVVNENGEVSDVTVARSVDDELDAEAIRVAKMLPRFEPGRINGKAVAVYYALPISFKLQENPNDKQ